MHAGDVEIAVARLYGWRQCFIVPNVSWGLNFIHELDMLVISSSGYATEIEIKVSLSDLKADQKKKHTHYSQRIKYFYFAVPEGLQKKALELIPDRAGLIVVREKSKFRQPRTFIAKTAEVNKCAQKLTESDLIKLGKLAAMRIWSLKEHAYRLQKENQTLRNQQKMETSK